MYKVITPSTMLAVPLDLFKVQTRNDITDTIQDSLLTQKLKAAQSWIERYCQYPIGDQRIEQRYGYLTSAMPFRLQAGNVRDIETIKYHDGTTIQTLSDTLYELDLYTTPAEVIVTSDALPTVDYSKPGPVRIEYNCGYTDVASIPDDIKEAILILATRMEAKRIDPTAAIGLVGHLIHTYKQEYAI